MIKQTTT